MRGDFSTPAHPPNRLFQFLYGIGLGPWVGRLVLLLTTTGRKTGRRHVTPLQYEEADGDIYVGSANGARADWVRNLLANPEVEVRVKGRHIRGCAQVSTDPAHIADFLELRLRRHPRMIGAIFRMKGLSTSPTRPELEAYASKLALVVIHPCVSTFTILSMLL